jgi:galactitol-specific phosphotransferase system IIB component
MNISYTIERICEQLGIKYKSIHIDYDTMKDAERLSEIYLELKQTIGELCDIEDRHHVHGIGYALESIIKTLDKIDHNLIKLAFRISKEKK